MVHTLQTRSGGLYIVLIDFSDYRDSNHSHSLIGSIWDPWVQTVWFTWRWWRLSLHVRDEGRRSCRWGSAGSSLGSALIAGGSGLSTFPLPQHVVGESALCLDELPQPARAEKLNKNNTFRQICGLKKKYCGMSIGLIECLFVTFGWLKGQEDIFRPPNG